MLRFMIFCHVWFLLPDVIHGIENSTDLQAGSFMYLASLSPSAVIRFSVLEDHQVCLPCGASPSSGVIWIQQNKKVLVTRQGSHQTNRDRQHYLLLGDGGLCMLKLNQSDSGEYQCNQRLVAELQVLTGHDFIVSAGWTLLLPCRGSSKPKHKWFRQREGHKDELIFTRFRNGSGKAETDGSRLGYVNDALQITDLQPEDTGEYSCNKILQAKITILEEHPEPTSLSSTTIPVSVSVSDVFEAKNTPKKRPENALLMVTVIALGIMIVLIALVCIFLTTMKCKKKRQQRYGAKRREETELQLWMTYNAQTEYEVFERPSLPEDTLHYASLGGQSWSHRPSWSLPDQSSSNVVYSSVITTPAAKHTFS